MYHVLKFLQLPYETAKRYVCVPRSWITVRLASGRRVFVAYPREEPALTRRRVRTGEAYDGYWQQFVAVELAVTDDFDTAETWIARMENADGRTRPIDADKKGDHSVSDTTRKIQSSNAEELSKTSNNKPYVDVEPHRVDQIVPMKHKLELPLQLNQGEKFNEKYQNTLNTCGSVSEKVLLINCNFYLSVMLQLFSINDKYFNEQSEHLSVSTVLTADITNQRASLQSNTEKTISSVQTSTSFPHRSFNLSDSICQSELPLFCKKSLFPDQSDQKNLGSDKTNSNDQTACTQSTPKTTASELMKLLCHLPQCTYDKRKIADAPYNPLREEPRRQEITEEKSTTLKHSGQSVYSLNNTKISPPIRKQSDKLTNQLPAVSKAVPQQMKQKDQRDNNILTSSKTKSSVSDATSTRSTQLGAKNVSKAVSQSNQIFEYSYKTQKPSEFNVLVKQDSQVNRIIITNPTEMELDDKLRQDQSIARNTLSAVPHLLQAATSERPDRIYKRLTEQPVISKEQLHRDQRTSTTIVRATTGEKPLDLISPINRKHGTKISTPLVAQNFSTLDNQRSQLSMPSNDNNTSVHLQNNMRKVTRDQELVPPSFSVDRSNLEPSRLQTDVKSRQFQLHPNIANHPNQDFERSDEKKQLSSILRAVILQDPHTGEIYLNNSNSHDQDTFSQSDVNSAPPVVQNMPTSGNRSYQFSDNLDEIQISACGNYLLHGTRVIALGHFKNVDDIIQEPVPENVSLTPSGDIQTQNKGSQCSSSYRSSYEQPVSLNHAYNNPCKQVNPCSTTRVFTEKNDPKQNVLDITKDSIDTANSLCSIIEESVEDIQGRLSLINLDSSQQQSSLNVTTSFCELPVKRHIDRDDMTKVLNSKINIEDNSFVIQNIHQNMTNQNESPNENRREPIHLDISDDIQRSYFEINTTPTFPNTLNPLCEISKETLEQIFLDYFEKLFEETDPFASDSSPMSQNECVIKYIKTFKKVLEVIKAFYNPTINKSTVSEAKHSKEKVNTNVYDDSDKNNKIPKEKSNLTHDPEDSSWTLKHKNPSPGVGELVPNSGVFINSRKLEEIKYKAKDCLSLARMVMMELFSQRAVKNCSIRGSSGTCVKAALDERALDALYHFVEEHAREKHWAPVDRKSIKKTLTIKLNNTRHRLGSI